MGTGDDINLVVSDSVDEINLFEGQEYKGSKKTFIYEDYFNKIEGSIFDGVYQAEPLEKINYNFSSLDLPKHGYVGSGSIVTNTKANEFGTTTTRRINESSDYYFNNSLRAEKAFESSYVEQTLGDISYVSVKEDSKTLSYDNIGISYVGTIRSYDYITTGGLQTQSNLSQLDYHMKNLGDINGDQITDYSVNIKQVSSNSIQDLTEPVYTSYSLVSLGSTYEVQDYVSRVPGSMTHLEAAEMSNTIDSFSDTVLREIV
ncbi:MAG: hypothetical protein AAGF07_05320 [Patescibacteria group bacterium]